MSALKETLLKRRRELQDQLKPLKKLEKELVEVDAALTAIHDKENRHGNEALGHPAGCRCYPHCDPSW